MQKWKAKALGRLRRRTVRDERFVRRVDRVVIAAAALFGAVAAAALIVSFARDVLATRTASPIKGWLYVDGTKAVKLSAERLEDGTYRVEDCGVEGDTLFVDMELDGQDETLCIDLKPPLAGNAELRVVSFSVKRGKLRIDAERLK